MNDCGAHNSMAVRVVTFAGSVRHKSLNKRLAKFAANRVSALGGIGVFVDLVNYPLPIYNGDFEELNGIPKLAVGLSEHIARADALMISTPEYNGDYPALLKNYIDWLTRVDRQIWVRPTALMSATPGPSGGRRSLVLLSMALNNMQVPVIGQNFSLENAAAGLWNQKLTCCGSAKDLDHLILKLFNAVKK